MAKKKSRNNTRSKATTEATTPTTTTSTTDTNTATTTTPQGEPVEILAPLKNIPFSKSPTSSNHDLSTSEQRPDLVHTFETNALQPKTNDPFISTVNYADHSQRRESRHDDTHHQGYLTPTTPKAPRRYEDDDDDHNHYSEQAPLIRSQSNDSNYSSGSGSSQRPPYPVRGSEPYEPTTWLEWFIKNGLHPRTWTRQTYIKAALLATLITLVVLSFTVFRIQDHIKDILKYIDSHKRIGALLFVVSYTVACTLFLPGSLFTIGAGFLFKPFPLALLIVLLGDIFAAVGSFIFGRYVFYDWVKGMMSKHPKFGALDQVIQDDGWKIVVMLRLTPIPFNLITYFFSVTSIRLWTVVWATCVGVFPGSCLGIWIGSLLKGLSGIDNPELETKNVVILVMNGVFIACCILALSLFGKRSLRKAMKRLDQHQALTSMHEVEVVVEGVASLVRELEDHASIPPSLRSTMIEQLAAEDGDRDYFHRGDLESQQRLLNDGEEGSSGGAVDDETVTASSSANSHRNNKAHRLLGVRPHHPTPTLPSSGFTRGEKITFVVIAAVALINVCVCVPLYYHYANQGDEGGLY
ncbi:hypothetical protein BG005_011149 [Podila minutissima]|nr:hypothetical protein BG005_011149 [Podila minutissima]